MGERWIGSTGSAAREVGAPNRRDGNGVGVGRRDKPAIQFGFVAAHARLGVARSLRPRRSRQRAAAVLEIVEVA